MLKSPKSLLIIKCRLWLKANITQFDRMECLVFYVFGDANAFCLMNSKKTYAVYMIIDIYSPYIQNANDADYLRNQILMRVAFIGAHIDGRTCFNSQFMLCVRM